MAEFQGCLLFRPHKVLIVDDQPANLDVIQRLLAAEGYELFTRRPYRLAGPPEDALAELEREARLGWRDRTLVDEFAKMATADLVVET